jgi:hypothetical protein
MDYSKMSKEELLAIIEARGSKAPTKKEEGQRAIREKYGLPITAHADLLKYHSPCPRPRKATGETREDALIRHRHAHPELYVDATVADPTPPVKAPANKKK